MGMVGDGGVGHGGHGGIAPIYRSPPFSHRPLCIDPIPTYTTPLYGIDPYPFSIVPPSG